MRRDRHDQRHGQVGGVLGQDAGRVGDDDAARVGGGDVDIVDAIAPKLAISLSRSPDRDRRRESMRSVIVGTSTSARLMASTNSSAVNGLSVS
jgi:hypothetical protein